MSILTSLTPEIETPETDVKIIRRIAYRFNEKGYFDGKRNHLFTMSPSNRKPTQITQGAYDVESPDWIDNNHIAFISNLTADADLTRDKYIYKISSTAGEPIQITQRKHVISVLKVAPNGDEIAYLGHDYRFGLATFQDLWVVSVDGKVSTNLTKTYDNDIGNSVVCDTRIETPHCNPRWSSDGKDIYFTLVRGGIIGLYKLSRKHLTMQKILGHVDHSIEAWSQSQNNIIAYTLLTTWTPIELWVLKNQHEIQLSSMNSDWINQHQISDYESYSYQSSSGHAVDGWIIRPPNFQQDAKYPLLLEIHGGPRGVYGYSFMYEFQVLAAQGWIVMFVNPYGSGGYTQEFQSLLPSHYGERDYQDLMEAIDYAIQNYPFIDANRLGVLGGSYGGFMTNWMITHTNRFIHCGRTFQPNPSVVGHFSVVPQLNPVHFVQEVGVAPKVFVTSQPTAAQCSFFADSFDHLPTQFWLSLELDVLGNSTFLTSLGIGLILNPFFRQIQLTVQQGVPFPTGITQEHSGLAVGHLAQLTAVLAFHAYRVISLFWKVAAVQDVHTILVSQILVYLLPMTLQDGFVTPGPLADEVLRRPNGIGVCPFQGQDHGLNGLAGDIQQQTIQIRPGPFPLLAATEQWAVDGVVLLQLIKQMVNVLGLQIHLRNGLNDFRRRPFGVMVRLDLW